MRVVMGTGWWWQPLGPRVHLPLGSVGWPSVPMRAPFTPAKTRVEGKPTPLSPSTVEVKAT